MMVKAFELWGLPKEELLKTLPENCMQLAELHIAKVTSGAPSKIQENCLGADRAQPSAEGGDPKGCNWVQVHQKGPAN